MSQKKSFESKGYSFVSCDRGRAFIQTSGTTAAEDHGMKTNKISIRMVGI